MNSSEAKKKRERTIMDFVYGSRSFFSVDESERPDFLIRVSSDDQPFGVEIAELFQSESQARLDRIPGYTVDLLGGASVRHKADRKGFKVDKIEIRTSAGEVRHSGVPAIIQTAPTIAACAAKIAEIILSKERKLEGAYARLRHINLIISDCTGLSALIKPSRFYRDYCTEELVRALLNSHFREVYFVAEFSRRRAYVPLKMVVAVAQLFFLEAFIRTRGSLLPEDRFMKMFASYMATIASGEVRLRGEGYAVEVLYGDTGFVLDDASGLQLRSYCDCPFGVCDPVGPGLPIECDSKFLDEMLEFQKANFFETGILFEANSGNYLEL